MLFRSNEALCQGSGGHERRGGGTARKRRCGLGMALCGRRRTEAWSHGRRDGICGGAVSVHVCATMGWDSPMLQRLDSLGGRRAQTRSEAGCRRLRMQETRQFHRAAVVRETSGAAHGVLDAADAMRRRGRRRAEDDEERAHARERTTRGDEGKWRGVADRVHRERAQRMQLRRRATSVSRECQQSPASGSRVTREYGQYLSTVRVVEYTQCQQRVSVVSPGSTPGVKYTP